MEMNLLQLAGVVIGSIISLGILIAGSGYAWSQFFKGAREREAEERKIVRDQTQSNTDVLALLNEQVETLKRLATENKAEIKNQHEEIIRLQEQIKYKDSIIKEYLSILQGRDPKSDNFMKLVTEAVLQGQEYMKTTALMLVEIKNFMTSVDSRLTHFGTREEDIKSL